MKKIWHKSNLFLLFYLFRLFDPLLQSYVPFAYFLKNHTKLRSGNIAHARPRIFPIEVFFYFSSLLLHNAIQITDWQCVKCEGLSFTSPSPLLHSWKNHTKRIRLRVFFWTVTNSILHFMNLFPHGYGETRYITGIFFYTVAHLLVNKSSLFLLKRRNVSSVF